jgi:hypothetical protein
MSGLRASRQADKGIIHRVCSTILCYLCATTMVVGSVKCLDISMIDNKCVFPIGLHYTSGGASDALIMADSGRSTDIQVGIYDGMIGGVMGCSDGCQVGVRQVGIHVQGWGGFRYPNQGTVEKPTQTNPIPTKFFNPYACACVRKSFSGGGGYRYPDYVGRV